jgi:hypothetical protein
MNFHLDALLNFPHVTVESCTQQSNELYLKLRLLNEEASCPREHPPFVEYSHMASCPLR